jgi:hypothetical protein
METETGTTKGGYYTVNLDIDGKRIPYIVFARSHFHAAHRVKEATGYAATDRDVEGPFTGGYGWEHPEAPQYTH